MPRLVYSTATRPTGWDALDDIVLWAVGQRPRPTFDEVAQFVPAGIAFHLIQRALDLAVASGLVTTARTDDSRFRLTPAGRVRLADISSRGHRAAA